MRSLLLIVPAVLMAQTPAPAPPKAPAATPKPATPAAAAPKPAAAGATTPKPAGTAAKPAAPKPAPAPLTTDEQKTIYSIGLSIYKSLAPFDFTPAELEIVKRAITDAQAKTPAIPLEEWAPKISGFVQTRTKAQAAAYLAKCAAEPGVVKTEGGVIYKELRAGDGESPKAADTVKVNYKGTLINGTEFDSSYKRGQPAEFQLNGVIKCWTEGVQKMKVGGKAQLVCPSELAYGEQGNQSIPPSSTLIFEIELLGITPAK